MLWIIACHILKVRLGTDLEKLHRLPTTNAAKIKKCC